MRAQNIPGPVGGLCPRCPRQLPAYGGQCLCGYIIPSKAADPPPAPLEFAHDPDTFRIAHLSDLHLGFLGPDGLSVQSRLMLLLETAKKVGVDHLVVSGDVSRVGKREELQRAADTLTAGGFPPEMRTVIPGNHDLQGSKNLDWYLESFPGDLPSVREVFPGVHIAAVDSNAVERADRSIIFERYVAPVQGLVGEASLEAVERDLMGKDGVRLLVLHHHMARHPPEDIYNQFDLAWGSTRVGTVLMEPVIDVAAVLAMARRTEITAILHGHKHWYVPSGYQVGGLPVFNAGAATLMKRPRFRYFDFRDGKWVGLYEVTLTL